MQQLLGAAYLAEKIYFEILYLHYAYTHAKEPFISIVLAHGLPVRCADKFFFYTGFDI